MTAQATLLVQTCTIFPTCISFAAPLYDTVTTVIARIKSWVTCSMSQ